MTDLNNPEEFAKAFTELDVTTDPETIRNAMHEPGPEPKPARHKYQIVGGEMVKVESDDE